MLADALQERVKPDGLAIVMEADHFCMHWRGVKDDDSVMTNSVMRGAFLKDNPPAPRVPFAAGQEARELKEESHEAPTLTLFAAPRGGAQPPRGVSSEADMLVRLMYASRAVPAVDAEELHSLLRQCRHQQPQTRHHRRVVLRRPHLFAGARGSRSAVNQLYRRIAADARHHDVELLSYQEIDERRFAGWAMGQAQMSGLNPALMLKYSAGTTLDPYAVPGRVSMALFDDLVATASIHCDRS